MPRHALAALLILGAISLSASGQSASESRKVQETYAFDSAAGLYRSAVGNDPNAMDDTVVPTIDVSDGLPSLRISPRGNWASATATVTCVRGRLISGVWTPTSSTSTPVTFDAAVTLGGLFKADDAVFDTGGAQFCRVHVSAISSGTVTLYKSRH